MADHLMAIAPETGQIALLAEVREGVVIAEVRGVIRIPVPDVAKYAEAQASVPVVTVKGGIVIK